MKKQLFALSILFISSSLGAMEAETITHPATDNDLKLIKAAQNNDIEECRTLIAGGANLEVKDEDGFTPLMLAINISIDPATDNDSENVEAKTELVSFLIDEGADIHAQSQDRTTLLNIAEKNKEEDIIKLLIKKEIDDLSREVEGLKEKFIKERAKYKANLTKAREEILLLKLSKGSNTPYIIGLVGSALGLYLIKKFFLDTREHSPTQTSEQDLSPTIPDTAPQEDSNNIESLA